MLERENEITHATSCEQDDYLILLMIFEIVSKKNLA